MLVFLMVPHDLPGLGQAQPVSPPGAATPRVAPQAHLPPEGHVAPPRAALLNISRKQVSWHSWTQLLGR